METLLKWLTFSVTAAVLVMATGDLSVAVFAIIVTPILCPVGCLICYGQPGPTSSELRANRSRRGNQ